MKTFILKRDRVPSNPPLKFAKKILKEARGYDKIISIGGGSTIDTAKYVALHLYIPHKAIPTTAGTGSEVTKFAVFTKHKKRFSIEDERLIPEEFELKPELVISCPPEVTVSSGLDALSQGIESYWSPMATKDSKGLAKSAIELVMEYLVRSYQNPKNEDFRMQMMKAAQYSGRAINITRTSICHAFSYPLTTYWNMSHGLACGVMLPIFIKLFRFRIVSLKDMNQLLKNLNVDRISLLKNVNKKKLIRRAFKSSRAVNIPFELNKQDIYKLLC